VETTDRKSRARLDHNCLYLGSHHVLHDDIAYTSDKQSRNSIAAELGLVELRKSLDAIKINGKRKEIPLENFPSNYEIFDIGKKTQKLFKQEIGKVQTIYMKGPAGYCAIKRFCKGTKVILKAVAKNKGFSLIGGGHLSDAIKMSKIPTRKFSHISLSGGALLSYIAGEKLVGLKALK